MARTLRDEVEGWDDDPQRLAEVQERRRLLGELRRKYGEDLRAVIAYGQQGAARLAALEDADGEAARLQAEHARCDAELAEAEAAVRATRARAAGAFGDLVGERLGDLAMAGARMEVRVAPDGTGEPVELALGANVGEPVQPLARAASGGELARAMLAIRLVGLGGPQTMVFDEVDAGVGGAAALALGEALHEVAAPPPGPGRHASGPGGVAGRRAGQRGQTGVPGPHRHHGDHGGGRGPGHRAVTDALGAPGQRRRPRARPRAPRARPMADDPPRVVPRSIIVVGCTDHLS